MRNQQTVFIGLFLMVFGLYAFEKNKNLKNLSSPPVSAVVSPSRSVDIDSVFENAFRSEIFRNRIDGLTLEPSRPPLNAEEFSVFLSGDDVYSSGENEIHENWTAVLDWLADFIVSNPCVEIEITAFSDDSDQREKTKADQGSGMIALSQSRAEWVRDWLVRKQGKGIEKQISEVRGLGPKARGKQIEFEFSCDEPVNSDSK